MASSTMPILATGAITLVNKSILHDDPIDWRIPVGTGFAAMAFAFLEGIPGGFGKIAGKLPWIALLTVLLARTDPKVPSPVETLAAYWKRG